MGLFEYVASGVREMAIARPDDNADLVYKHPNVSIPRYAQCTVRADEWAVVSRNGAPVGSLDAGRHTLVTDNVPFLSHLIDAYSGGNLFIAEVFFVKRIPFSLQFAGSLGSFLDPMTNIRVQAHGEGSVLVRVENPERLIYGYFGMQNYQVQPNVFAWLTDALFMTVKTTLGQLMRYQNRSLFDAMDLSGEIAQRIVHNAADLAQIGLRAERVTRLSIDAG